MDETAEQVVVEQVDDFSMEIELALQVSKPLRLILNICQDL